MPPNTLTVYFFFSSQYSQEPESSCFPLIKVSHSVPSWMRPVGALIILPKTDPRPVLSCKYKRLYTTREAVRQVELPHHIVFGSGAPLHTKPSLSHSQKRYLSGKCCLLRSISDNVSVFPISVKQCQWEDCC